MARIRSIHPDQCKSEKLSAASDGAERCFVRLLTQCDDDGRCEDNPKLLKSSLFPLRDAVRPATVDRWLTELAGLGLVIRYTADDGHRYLQVNRWRVYQKPRRVIPSDIPAPRPADSGHPPTGVGQSPTPDGQPRPGVGVGGERSGYMEREGESEGETEPRPSDSGEAKVMPLRQRAAAIEARYGEL